MKSLFNCLIFLALPMLSYAQQQANDSRTLTTKIADVLAKFPVQDKSQYAANVDQIRALGKDGLQQLIGMLSTSGKRDNTALEYAISAYSSSVMQGKQSDRNTTIDVYCNALKQVDVDREFIVRQLQLVGNENALGCLQPLLNEEKLAGPAARAIAQVNTEAAGKLLLQALATNDAKDKVSIVQALGYTRYPPAADVIQTEFMKGDAAMKKAALYALGEIGELSSAKLLHDEAKKVKFSIDKAGATDAYLKYLHHLAARGQTKQAAKLAEELISESTATKNVHARIAALTLAVDLNKSKAQPLLYKAVRDQEKEYRAAALNLAARSGNTSPKQWMDELKNVTPSAKAQIINYLANSGDKSIAGKIDDFVFDPDDEVREAALNAVAKIQQQDAFPVIVSVLQKGNEKDINTAKSALLRLKMNNIGTRLAEQFENLPPAGTVAALEVIAARSGDDAVKKVFELTKSSNSTIRMAALKALPYVAGQNDLPQLFSMLSTAEKDDLSHLQHAITAASSDIKDTSNRTSAITTEMNKVAKEKKHLFIPVLASIGGREALSAIEQLYKNGLQQDKIATVEALSKNTDAQSASILLNIARNPAENKVAAVNGYINIIQKGNFTADQKVTMLQEAMQLASNTEQRKKIIQQAGRNVTWISLVFAGKYIDNPELQREAAFAIMNIALSNPQFIGKHVRDLLQKSLKAIKGNDSDYQKEAIRKHLADMPPGEGFLPMFNGENLNGWKGLVEDPVKRSQMTPVALAAAQKKANEKMKEGWQAKDGLLVFTGHGDNLATEKQYADFEMLVDWKITAEGDAGIYLRGTPQVQIWDTSRRDVGAQVGSGGLYNNEKNPSKPLQVADNPIGEWNNFRIIMKDDKVTVYLNGQLVTDNVPLENYWDRKQPIFPKEQIELQAHGTYVAYRNLYIKELGSSKPFVLPQEEKQQNFKVLFDGTNLDQWVGNKKDYVIENNELVVKPTEGAGGGNLFTKDEYANFIFRFEFLLTPGANNGLGIRAPLEGDAAYTGMELQILDNEADIYKDLKPFQYHGSVYGILPAKRGFLKPTGEWNQQEVIAKGTKIKVILNGTVILDGDIKEARENGTADKQDHPGVKRDKGHIGFLGHGSVLKFRNIRIKDLDAERQ